MDLLVHDVRTDDGLRIAVGGELDLSTSPRLQGELQRLVGLHPGINVVLDLLGVGFIDASGFGVLVDIRRRVVRSGGAVRVLVGDGPVREQFIENGLDQVFTLDAESLDPTDRP